MKSRIFNVMQYERHPETGAQLLSEETIIVALRGHKTVTRYAYIRHDADVYSEADEADDANHAAGQVKPPHWHIVIECKNTAVEISTVAKWFNIPDNFVNIGKGAGAFLDCVKYLTHEDAKQQLAGKHRYEDDKIKSNFEFRKELDLRDARKLRYGKDLNERDALRNEVLYHGMTLRDVAEKDPLGLQNDLDALRKFRLYYIDRYASMPDVRMNYYVQGMGGVGKGLICRALARSLYLAKKPDVNRETLSDDDIFFEVGSDKTTFEGYDGQPIIIWNDCRAITLLNKLGGRENVFNVFDLFPPSIRQNIKYGSVRLTNEINIVNSVEPWREFFDGLAGEYKTANGEQRHAEDKSQSYRRFPFFLVLHEEDYDIGMNKGLFDGTREFEQFIMYERIRCNMRKIATACGKNLTLRQRIEGQAVRPVVEHHAEMLTRFDHPQAGTDEEILAAFADVGEPVGESNA